MPAYLNDLVTARDNAARVLALESVRRLGISVAGHPIVVSYSAGGKSVSWSGSLKELADLVKQLNETIQLLGGDGGIPEASVQLWG